MRVFGLLLLLCVLLGVQTPASAIYVVGDPFEGQSWGQRFQENGVGPYDFMRIDWISGSDFEPPVFRNFSVGGWTYYWGGPKAASALGTALTDSQFDIVFMGSPLANTSFYFTAYNGNTLLESAKATWNGSWAVTAANWHPDNPRDNPAGEVPEPITLVLICAGLGVTSALKGRRKTTS